MRVMKSSTSVSGKKCDFPLQFFDINFSVLKEYIPFRKQLVIVYPILKGSVPELYHISFSFGFMKCRILTLSHRYDHPKVQTCSYLRPNTSKLVFVVKMTLAVSTV